MSVQNILIEFSAETTELKTAIDILEEQGLIDKKLADQYRNTNKVFKERNNALKQSLSIQKENDAAIDKTTSKIDALNTAFKTADKAFVGKVSVQALKDIEKAAGKSEDEFENLNDILNAVKNNFDKLDLSPEEFEQLNFLIGAGEETLKQFGNQSEQVTQKKKKLTTELRDLREELALLKIEGKENTQEFKDMAQKAATLQDALDDASREIRGMANDTATLSGLVDVGGAAVGIFSAWEGAIALVGAENEDLQRTLVKLNGLIAILNGLTQVQNILQKESAGTILLKSVRTKALASIQRAYNAVVGTSTGLLKAFKIALASTGIGLFIIALGTLLTRLSIFNKRVDESTDSLRELGQEVDNISSKVGEEIFNSLSQVDGGLQTFDQRLQKIGGTIKLLTKGELESLKLFLEENLSRALRDAANAQGEFDKNLADTTVSALETELEKVNAELELFKIKTDETKKKLDAASGSLEFLKNKVTKAREEFERLDSSTPGFEKALFNLVKLEKAYDSLQRRIEFLRLEPEDVDIDGFTNEFIEQFKDTDIYEPLRKQLNESFKELSDQPIEPDIDESDFNSITSKYDTILRFQLATNNGLKSESEIIQDNLKEKIAALEKEKLFTIEYFELKDQLRKQEEAEEKRIEEQRLVLAASRIGTADNIGSSAFDITQSYFNAELQALQNQKDQQLISEEEFARKKASIQRKQAIASRAQAVFEIGINTASAIVEALPNIPLSIIAGTIGAAQLTFALSRKIPQFRKGTPKAPSGFKWVGEDGPELIHDGGGYPIITNEDSEELASLLDKYSISHSIKPPDAPKVRALQNTTLPSLPKQVIQNIYNNSVGNNIDYKKLAVVMVQELNSSDRKKSKEKYIQKKRDEYKTNRRWNKLYQVIGKTNNNKYTYNE